MQQQLVDQYMLLEGQSLFFIIGSIGDKGGFIYIALFSGVADIIRDKYSKENKSSIGFGKQIKSFGCFHI